MRLGADSGGTFTDVVGTDGSILKILSTPDDPGRALRTGVGALAPEGAALLAHGTTVATNALLERRVSRVALVATAGFSDVIEIARQDRPSLYDPWNDRAVPLVARSDRHEVQERLAGTGEILVPYRAGSVPQPSAGVGSVAVCLLHSDVNPCHEEAVCADLEADGWDVSASHLVSPEFREYERMATTVINAALRPVCRPYLAGLSDIAVETAVMTSAGGLVDLRAAGDLPASLLLSGPAAGVRAAAAVAMTCGFSDALSFDMGGTSTDVCLITGGEPALSAQHMVAGLPVRMAALDVHTVGAGGGSVARLDGGGALVVGPESAGADPGPACYGRGGSAPTVTDANLAAGRIPMDAAFGSLGTLDRVAAEAALARAGVAAQGVIDVVNAGMEQALRAVSVERGVDPRALALVAFGGAGPLHACDLADSLKIPVVIVPAAAGVLSAVGLLISPRRRDVVRSRPDPADLGGLQDLVDALAHEASELLGPGVGPVTVTTAVDCRYHGQSHEIRVPTVPDFAGEHLRRNGYVRSDDQVEVTAVRAMAEAPAPAKVAEVLSDWHGRWTEPVVGPRVVTREDCTIWVPDGWVGEPAPLGALVLRRAEPRPL